MLLDIIEWLEDKPKFWQEAVSRIIRNNEINDTDLNDLVKICKIEFGISSETVPLIDLEELKKLVASSHSEEALSLSKICNSKNINALKESEELKFAQTGLTAVYGGNGAGKSSYVSILKHICNTRGSTPTINPNLFISGSGSVQKTSELEYATSGGESGSVKLVDGTIDSHILKAVNVFDSESANDYIQGQDEIAFMPIGLVVLEKLAHTCRLVETMLNTEQTILAEKAFDYSFLVTEDNVDIDNFLNELTFESERTELSALADFGKAHQKRLDEIEEKIAKLKSTNPHKVIVENESKIQRFGVLIKKYGELEIGFENLRLETVNNIYNEYLSAKSASETASGAFKNLSDLEVGNENWKALWESARKFYNTSTGTKDFPKTEEEGDSCPLCLQELGNEAQERFKRFEEFVEADIQKQLHQASIKLQECINFYNSLDYDEEQFAPTIEELELEITEFSKEHENFISEYTKNKDMVLNDLKKSKTEINLQSNLHEISLIEVIKIKIKELEAKNELLKKMQVEEELQKLVLESNSILAIKELQKHEKTLLEEIDRKNLEQLYIKAKSNCNTRNTTILSNTLSEKFVTKSLKDNFELELKKLGFKNIQITTHTKGERGKQYHYLQLDSSYGQSVGLSDILSEGEHRCISLATFFSELSLAGHNSAVIFDDPVSSLDHNWKEVIAERIVEESKIRQVIVLTHDITFLMVLEEIAIRESCGIHIESLTRKKTETGIIANKPPWYSMTVKSRLGVLNEGLQALKNSEAKETQEEYDQKVKPYYSKLRETWERVVEELVLNKTVQRFGREISTQRLEKVIDLTEADYKVINDNMTRCSKLMLGHDTAGALLEKMPDCDSVENDLNSLKDYIKEMRSRKR